MSTSIDNQQHQSAATQKSQNLDGKRQQDIVVDMTLLEQVCSSKNWQRQVWHDSPFNSKTELYDSADKAFSHLTEEDWLEAFAGHPMIGDISTLEEKYNQGKSLSEGEQSQVSTASKSTLKQLLKLNQEYLKLYGFIFIVCATNKSAEQMLELLQQRLGNSRNLELLNASVEQRKISQIRMETLI